MLATSPSGEDVCQCKSYDEPSLGVLPQPVQVSPGVWKQGFAEKWSVNGSIVGYEVRDAAGVYVNGNAISQVQGLTADGGWQVVITNLDTGMMLLTETVYLTGPDGSARVMGDYLSNPASLRDFSRIGTPVGINVKFSSSYFSGPDIDLLLLPDFMDADF